MYRYGRPGRGRHREHWQLSLEAMGSADPAIDAEIIEFYDSVARSPRRVDPVELSLNSIGDRELPAAVHGSTERVARRTSRAGRRRGRCRSAPRARCRCSTSRTSGCVRRCSRHRRSASRCAAPAASTSTRCAATSTCTASATCWIPILVRGLDYYSRTTFEFTGPDENVDSTICGGGRYDWLIEQIGGPADARGRVWRRPRAAAPRRSSAKTRRSRRHAGSRRLLRLSRRARLASGSSS